MQSLTVKVPHPYDSLLQCVFGAVQVLTSYQMEEELNILVNGRQPNFFLQMEDDLHLFANGRQPQKY